MGFWILVAISIGLIAWAIVLWCRREHYNDGDVQGGFGIALLIILAIWGTVTSFSNVGNLASMEAFYQTNSQNYAQTIQETKDVLTIDKATVVANALIPIEGSIERVNVGSATTDRIMEYRNKINEYNRSLSVFKAFDHNWLVGCLTPTPPEYLKPIVMK